MLLFPVLMAMSLVVQLQCLLQLAQFRYYFDALNCVVPLIVHSMIMLLFCLQSLILLKLRARAKCSYYFVLLTIFNVTVTVLLTLFLLTL